MRPPMAHNCQLRPVAHLSDQAVCIQNPDRPGEMVATRNCPAFNDKNGMRFYDELCSMGKQRAVSRQYLRLVAHVYADLLDNR